MDAAKKVAQVKIKNDVPKQIYFNKWMTKIE
jgi:hypothetical protein